MDIKELIYGRRTVHQYVDKQVPDTWIKEALELATYAPNHRKTWPWRFFWLGEHSRDRLVDIVLDLKIQKRSQGMSEVEKNALREKFKAPAHLILVGYIKSGDAVQEKEDFASLACALQNMALYFWEKGVGTKWGTGPIVADLRTYELVKKSEAEISIEGLFWVGIPAKVPSKVLRPAVTDFYEKFE